MRWVHYLKYFQQTPAKDAVLTDRTSGICIDSHEQLVQLFIVKAFTKHFTKGCDKLHKNRRECVKVSPQMMQIQFAKRYDRKEFHSQIARSEDFCRILSCNLFANLLTSLMFSSPLPSSSAVKKAVLSCMISCKLIRSLAFYFLTTRTRNKPESETENKMSNDGSGTTYSAIMSKTCSSAAGT